MAVAPKNILASRHPAGHPHRQVESPHEIIPEAYEAAQESNCLK
jgi:hypothetical protein